MLFAELLKKSQELAEASNTLWPDDVVQETDDQQIARVLKIIPVAQLQIETRFKNKDECGSLLRLQRTEKITRTETLKALNEAVFLAPAQSNQLIQSVCVRAAWLHQNQQPALASRDARFVLQNGSCLPIPDRISMMAIRATFHEHQARWSKAQVVLRKALSTLAEASLENSTKASLAAQLAKQLKRVTKNSSAEDPSNRQQENETTCLFGGEHGSLPGASRYLKLSMSQKRGRCLVADEDIPVGSIVIYEEPWAWTLQEEMLSSYCLNCCLPFKALLPCNHCAEVGFCSERCRREAADYHDLECRVLSHLLEACRQAPMAWLAFRTLAMAQGNGVQSTRYQAVQDQITHSGQRSKWDVLTRAVTATFLAKCWGCIRPEDNTAVIASKLLGHLKACSCNAYDLTSHQFTDSIESWQRMELGGAVYPTLSLTNHCCYPNLTRHTHGRRCIVRTTRWIHKGEELLDNYGPHFLESARKERRRELLSRYYFECECFPCLQNWNLQMNKGHRRCYSCSNSIGSSSRCRGCGSKDGGLNEKKAILEAIRRLNIEKSLPILTKQLQQWRERGQHQPSRERIELEQAIIICWNVVAWRTNEMATNIAIDDLQCE